LTTGRDEPYPDRAVSAPTYRGAPPDTRDAGSSPNPETKAIDARHANLERRLAAAERKLWRA
jgi:hypothetical protein